MTKADLRVAINELKSLITCKDIQKDIQLVGNAPNKSILNKENRRNESETTIIWNFVYETYFERAAVEQLVYEQAGTLYSGSPLEHRLAQLIVREKKPQVLEKMYQDYIRAALSEYFEDLSEPEFVPRDNVEKGWDKWFEDHSAKDFDGKESAKKWKQNALLAYAE